MEYWSNGVMEKNSCGMRVLAKIRTEDWGTRLKAKGTGG
jgi:hypothetical protein